MGMFDKDKMYGGTPLEEWIQKDTDFILYDAWIETEDFPLDDGKTATKTCLAVATTEQPNNVVKVSTLGGVTAEKVKDAEPDDFPAICQFQEVPASTAGWSNAKVVKFVRPGDKENVPTFSRDDLADAGGSTTATEAAPA